MKKILVMMICCMILVGCGTKPSYQTITAEKANEMMTDRVVILDVRTNQEYQNMHIKDAVNVPVEKISQENISTISELKAKDVTILVYCQTGARSEKAAQRLVDLGYTKVYNFGGIVDWPYGLVKESISQ